MTPDAVVAEARRWVGTRYRVKGRSETGLDCIGLLVVVARSLGVPHTDRLDYADWPDPNHAILRELGRDLVRMPGARLSPGTIGVFAEQRLPCHCGFFSERQGVVHVIHARLRSGRVLEEPYVEQRTNAFRLIAQFRFPQLEV